MKKLTSKSLWQNYWTDEKIDFLLKRTPYFANLLDINISKKRKFRFIEIGGFPGLYCYYMISKYNCDSVLLDYYTDNKILEKVAKSFNLKKDRITSVKKDLFKYSPDKKFDLVFSSGFIEHFDNPEKVIRKHLELLTSGGSLLITLPNYRGINGLLQKKFDREFYKLHNIETMKINKLKNVLNKLELKNYNIYYFGNSGVWFEDWQSRPLYLKSLVYLFYVIKFPLKFLNIESRLLSPHIVIEAKKK